jgi:hypothetical protein
MKFKIKMLVEPGNKFVTKGVITKVDAKGVESVDQMILEGEKVEVDCNVAAGEALMVRELPPPMKVEDMATKPATWEDVAEAAKAAQPPPPTTPTPKTEHPKTPEHPAAAQAKK